jgi:hypothetical protein
VRIAPTGLFLGIKKGLIESNQSDLFYSERPYPISKSASGRSMAMTLDPQRLKALWLPIAGDDCDVVTSIGNDF